jgi:hypothetical protein
MKRFKPVNITKGIKFSKPNSEWICSWCEKRIQPREESILFSGLKIQTNGLIYTEGFGSRIHLLCLEPMCEELKEAVKNKTKYAIVNNLNK